MSNANLRRWIEEAAEGEAIEAVVIGEPAMGLGEDPPIQRRGVVLSWDEAAPMLDYDFDSGFGQAGCNSIWAWTATRVISVSEYDGATWPFWIPRNPTAGTPKMPGGG